MAEVVLRKAPMWRLVRAYVSARIRAQHQYRLSFYLRLLASTGGTVLDFVVILVIFQKLPSMRGWMLWEVAFLYGASYMPFKLADLAVGNVERLGDYVKTGLFDSVMIRPASPLLQMMFTEVELIRIGGALQGLVVFLMAATRVSIDWDLLHVFQVLVMVASGFVIYCSIWVMGHTVAFWLTDVKEVFNAFTYGGNFVTQFPLDIFAGWMKRLFAFVVPVAFVNYFPVANLLGKQDTFGLPAFAQLLSPLVAAAMMLAAAFVWRLGVRQYRSTGS